MVFFTQKERKKKDQPWNQDHDVLTLVENMVKKTVVIFPLRLFWPPWFAVTKLMQICFLGFYECNFEIMGACNTPLERCFQDLSRGILKSTKFLKFYFVNQKNTYALV